MNPQAHHGGSPLAPNTMVDHFKVAHLLDRGGMGDVYLARDTQLGRKVALKLVRPEDLGDSAAKESFLFEARVTAQFSHPHIVTIYAVGEYAGQPYLALEYLDGQSLGARLLRGPLGSLEAARIGLAIAEALGEAHGHNILHRDLKSENVFLAKDGRLRVLDFGLARVVKPERPSAEPKLPEDRVAAQALLLDQPSEDDKGGLVGTPSYMAPECWSRDKVGPATDVFALGVVLFEMVEGQLPFRGNTWHAIQDAVCNHEAPRIEAADVPMEIKELVTWCLAKQPEDRPTVAEVVAVLGDVMSMGRGRVRTEESPFRGLLPFTEAHAGSFFGRDEEVGAFVERLRDEPLLAVVGPSGAGKSSFVQAGVVPRLREQRPWLVLVVRPGRAPFEALCGAIVRAESQSVDIPAGVSMAARSPESAGEEAALAADFVSTPGLLGIRLIELAERRRADVLLFVDQLEELVALGADEQVRRRFMEALSAAADDAHSPVRVVVTLRDDFLGQLAEGPAARRALSQVVVLRSPGPSALAEIASRPLADVGYAYEDPQLPTAMAAAVQGEAASLPLLQFALGALWKARDRKRKLIPQAAYTALGGVEGALAGHADGVMSGLSPKDLRAAREIFLRLVTPSRTRRAVPRDELLSGLPASAVEVLDRLVQERALVAHKGRGAGRPELEIVHESLIRRWETLARWLDESREEHAFLTEARAAAAAWENHGRRTDELWQGDALRDGERLAARLNTLPDDVRRFLAAGRHHARGRQRRLWLAVSFAFAFVVAVAAGLFVMNREAERQRVAAEQQRAQALFAMAQALSEKAKDLNAKTYHTSAAIYAAASLLNNPANPGSPHYGPTFAGQMEAARELVLDARSELYHAKLGSVFGRTRRFELPNEPTAIVLTPDGERLLVGLLDGTVDVFEIESGRRILEKQIHSDRVYSIAVTPKGKLAASGGETGGIRLWQLETGEPLGALVGHEGAVFALAFTPDGTMLVSSGEDGTIRTWDLAALQSVATLQEHVAKGNGLGLSRDGQILAVGSSDGMLRTLGLPEGTLRGQQQAHTDVITDVAFTANDATLLTSSFDSTVGIWRAADLTLLRRIDYGSGQIMSTRGLSGGLWLAALSNNDEVIFTETLFGTDLLRIPAQADLRITNLAVAKDGELIAFPAASGVVEVWRQQGPPRVRVLGVHDSRVFKLAWSPDGSLLVSASYDQEARLWDARSGEQLHVFEDTTAFIEIVGFSPDGRHLATLSLDYVLRLWDPQRGVLEASVVDVRHAQGFGFSPDSTTLALNGGDRHLWLLDIASGTVTKRADIAVVPEVPVEFSSPRSLLIPTPDGGIESLDLDSGKRRPLPLPTSCNWFSWLPRTRAIACGNWEREVIALIDPEQGREMMSVHLPGFDGFESSANERLGLIWDDKVLVAFALDTGELLMRLTFPATINTASLSPDGKTIAVASQGVVMTMPFELEVLTGLAQDPVKELAAAEVRAGKRLNGFELEPIKN